MEPGEFTRTALDVRRDIGAGEPIIAGDLVGCRYRLIHKLTHPFTPATRTGIARAERADAARAAVFALLPAPTKNFKRVDLPAPDGSVAVERRAQARAGAGRGADDKARAKALREIRRTQWEREIATLEFLAAGVDLITNARFAQDGWAVDIDALVRDGNTYLPLLVSNHRVARKVQARPENPNHRKVAPAPPTLPAVPTHRVGLSQPLELPYRLRHHVADGYKLALAARGLRSLGLDSGRAFVVGQDRETAFVVEPAAYEDALDAAFAQEVPTAPRRVKECAGCRFWDVCRPQLEAADEISLFLPGDRARPFRERGIDSVQGLIDADLGEISALARAWREDVALLRRPGQDPRDVKRADVEVDVDMEAYLDQGAYLWGAWHAGEYQAFVTWQPLGGAAEATNFAEFWGWLQGLRAQAHAEGKTFAAYCYSANGENHWMTMSAQRFGEGPASTPGVPTLAEVREFLESDEWVDMFVHVKRAFVGPQGLSLKVVAPVAGHAWPDDEFDGEESVNARREAVTGNMDARRRLLEYNRGDVQATAKVREWMSAGAPGIGELGA